MEKFQLHGDYTKWLNPSSQNIEERASSKVAISADRLSTDRENEGQQSEGYLSAYDGGETFQLPAKVEKVGVNSDPIKLNHRWYMKPSNPHFCSHTTSVTQS